METVIDPLYFGKENTTPSVTTKNVTVARIENTQPGVCPKCHTHMTTAPLGQAMGNQRVYFCQVCRVAEPMPTGI